jgi:hypothetical protein
MIAHLSEQTMTDVLEGGGSPVEWAHVASCPACRSRLDEARAGRALASKAEVPEPPGLYWEALRRSVSRRIAEEPARRVRWDWVVPLVAAVAAILVIGLSVGVRSPALAPTPLPAWSALPPLEEDPGLAVVNGLADGELGEWTEWNEGRGLGAFVAGLSDEESEALVAALSDERSEEDL